MYLGIYDIDGDPDELLAAYDRVMARMPEGQVYFHACAVRENGITIYDACPTREAFGQYASRQGLLSEALTLWARQLSAGAFSSPWPGSRLAPCLAPCWPSWA